VDSGHSEAAALLDRSDDTLLHDDLAEINQPFYLHQFVADAARHGLQFLGDAERLFPSEPDAAQYRDFVELRSFRQSLLCRGEEVLDRTPEAAGMERFFYSSPEPSLFAGALADAYPLPLPFEELTPYCGGDLGETLLGYVREGAVYPHVYEFPCEESVTERPIASLLARHQAAVSDQVTNLCHHLVELPEELRRSLLLLDGTHACQEFDGSSLEWLARMALLIG
jgi:hypothetical protein